MHKQEKERVSERERQEGVASTYFLLFLVDRRRVRGRLLFSVPGNWEKRVAAVYRNERTRERKEFQFL
jgi:hypothetical protein